MNNGIHGSSAANNGRDASPPTNARRESFTGSVYVHAPGQGSLCKRFQNFIDSIPAVIYRHNLDRLKLTLATVFLVAALGLSAPKDPQVLTLSGDVEGVHDPVILIKQKDTYYVFCTGGGRGGTGGIIPIRTSKDLLHWTNAGTALPGVPEWGQREIPGARGAWAPDISYFKGKYHLYYALSTFGSRNSAIGLATNLTLDPADPRYSWNDEGMVLRSFQDKDDWNAIDPNLVVENEDSVWLNWGSFWGGIKMRRLDPDTGKPSDKYPTLYSLCTRPREQSHHSGSVEGALHRQTRRVVVSVRLLRPLLPGRQQHL